MKGMEDIIHTISIHDDIYPTALKTVRDAPRTLFVRGSLHALSHPNLLAVVGSRKADEYGKECIEQLLPGVIQSNICIVSGLAYGIDSMAHVACVRNNAPTIAVLGSGVDTPSIYPRDHVQLAHDIIQCNGCIVSEYPPGTGPQKHHFPARNRIISGLCSTTLVVQAGMRSGSLITARLALEEGRDVLAVPGRIAEDKSRGTNQLIQDGALPVLKSEDILSAYQEI